MYEKLLSIVRKLPFISGDSSSAQLLRTYIVGGFNLVFGLVLNYIFQFLVLSSVEVPLRTYLTNVFSFSLGVLVSYFISRKIIFKLSIKKGKIKEFINFLVTSLFTFFPLLPFCKMVFCKAPYTIDSYFFTSIPNRPIKLSNHLLKVRCNKEQIDFFRPFFLRNKDQIN